MKYRSEFYNTIGLTGDELRNAISDTESQDRNVLKLMKVSGKDLTASDLCYVYDCTFHEVPITSIRRALNTLEKNGYVEKTGKQRMSPYGRPENIYRLV